MTFRPLRLMTDHSLVTDNDVCLELSQSGNLRAKQTHLGTEGITFSCKETHSHRCQQGRKPPGNTNRCEKFKSPQQRQNTILTDTDTYTHTHTTTEGLRIPHKCQAGPE